VTKNVPKGNLLLRKNTILIEGAKVAISSAEISEIIRQKPNSRVIGIPYKLILFNSIDSAKVSQKRMRINAKIVDGNKRMDIKLDEINAKRIEKARKKGKKMYTKKIKEHKEIENSRLFIREWIKYKLAEKPIVYDSLLLKKSMDQIGFYLKRKGFYYGSISFSEEIVRDNLMKITYKINPGPCYLIDSVYTIGPNSSVISAYSIKFLKAQKLKFKSDPLVDKPFDLDYLEDYRESIAKFMRDEAYYGFTASSISLLADTNKSSMKVVLGLEFKNRLIPFSANSDSLIEKRYGDYRISSVNFHLSDTTMLKQKFSKYLDENENVSTINPIDKQFLATKNSFLYAEQPFSSKQLKEKKIKDKDSLSPMRMATIFYNGKKPSINVNLLELQNYLEMTNVYKEYYLERSFQCLTQLGLFSTIKPVVLEKPNNTLEVHYFLVPSERKTFAFEPKFTSSFGLLGVNASINYSDKNIFGGGEKVTFSFGFGFESQPIVFDDGSRKGLAFNTFEFGPSIKLEIPGLFPTKVTALSKRQKPKTILSLAYNYEKRNIFERNLFQMNYTWKMLVDKTQIFEIGLPLASVIKYVDINKSPEFESQINAQNDLFLRNSYSSQFIWEDFKLTFIYDNSKKQFLDTKNKLFKNRFLDAHINFTSSFSAAGILLSKFNKYQDTLPNGQFSFFNVGYAEFIRNDNTYILNKEFNKKTSINLKLQAGFGIPFGNSKTSMPYDYSFFGGGANDNRGWKARTLGPGSYKYYIDSSNASAQIGDIRLGGTIEYRYSIGSTLKGAIFTDFGNIWTYKEDAARAGAKFENNWLEQFAVTAGLGFRLDLDFFIIRLDLGIPIYNPALPKNARWINQSREPFYQEGISYYGLPTLSEEMNRERALSKLPKPFAPALQFGIGYPF
jgi:hypothetical protein